MSGYLENHGKIDTKKYINAYVAPSSYREPRINLSCAYLLWEIPVELQRLEEARDLGE
jgi:hypothetical protein